MSSTEGHENVVRLLIEKGANINAGGNKYYCNALDAALHNSHESIAELLLENGADLCAQGPAGSVLYAAASRGNEKMVECILRRGGNVNAIGGSYGSPLGGACSRGYLFIVRMLLQYGADVNAQGGEYGNALQAAAGSGDEEIIRLLLDRSAHLHVYTPREGPKTALGEASKNGHDAAVKLLLSAEARAVTAGAEPNGYGNALHAAAGNGHLSTVRLLIAEGADVNAKGKFWDTDEKLATPLYISVYRGNKTIVRELLSNGAEVNAHGGEFGTAYQIAVIERQHSITQLLLAYGADPSREFELQIEDLNKCFSPSVIIYQDGRSKNKYKLRNPVQMSGFMLHRAVDNASVELTKFALEHGTYVDTANGDGMTPLLLAAKDSHVQIMELLLDEGADCDANSKTNRTALHWAAENGDFGALQLLLSHIPSTIDANEGMWGQTPLIRAARYGNTSAVRQLLTHGANPNIQDNRGDAAIYRAVRYNHVLVVRILLLSGARADIQNNKGRTPMWKAQNLGHTAIVNLLKRYTQH
jgi:ankyrin repeat protein